MALVTGGAGFIGSHLVDRLLRDGWRVTVLDNLSSGNIRNLEWASRNGNFKFINGDVVDKAVLKSNLNGVEAVVHLAAVTSVAESLEDPDKTMRTNVEGTGNILFESITAGVKRFVFASTCAVYGDPKEFPVHEGYPVNPLSPYASSKLKAETLCEENSSRFPDGMTIFRFFNVFGPRQSDSQYGGVIARFTDWLSSGKRPVIYGDGTQTRDFVYVGDVVEAMTLSLSSKANFGIFNIGTGVETSVLDLEVILAGLLGEEGLKPIHESPRNGEIFRSVADISRANKTLGYAPKVPIGMGLKETVGELITRQ